MTRHPRHPRQSNVEQVERMLDDGLDIDEIAIALRLTEGEVGRIASLLAARGPADPAPDVDVAALAAAADEVLTVDDDEPSAPTRPQVKAAALLCRRATSQDDLQDLAGALGIRHAIDPAERWLNARTRAATAPVMAYISEPSGAVENHATPLLERLPGGFVRPAPEQPSMTDRLAEHVAAYAAPSRRPTGIDLCRCTIIAARTLHEPDAWEQADDCPVHPLAVVEPCDECETTGRNCIAHGGRSVVSAYLPPDGEPIEELDTTWTAPSASRPATASDSTPPESPTSASTASSGGSSTDGSSSRTEHVHDPFVAWHENGIPYATCTCGTTWERQTCTLCPAIVTALWVAQHGPTHGHCAAKKATS